MDSKLVVEQMSGRWQVKHPAMKPLAAEAQALVRRLPSVRFRWIPRAQNSHADRLANEAMDAAARGDVWRAGGDSGPADAADSLARRARADRVPGPPRRPAATPQHGWRDEPSAPPTTALLLRHGQTELSVQKRFSGTGDQPLTEHGRRQAAAAAARLATSGATAVVSSPRAAGARDRRARRGRARRRGRHRAGPARDRLRRLGGVHVRRGAGRSGRASSTPGSPTRRWRRRTARASTRRRRACGRPAPGCSRRTAGSASCVVSHVTPIKTLLRLALDAPPSALYRIHLDLTCLSEVQWFADGPAVVRSMNDTAHVPPGRRRPARPPGRVIQRPVGRPCVSWVTRRTG